MDPGDGPAGQVPALNRLLAHATDAELVLFVDDDVRLPPDFLPNYLALVSRLGVALAQPALKAGSYHSHPITLEQKGLLGSADRLRRVGAGCVDAAGLPGPGGTVPRVEPDGMGPGHGAGRRWPASAAWAWRSSTPTR